MQLVEIPMQDTFQALSDPTRLRIICLLASTHEEACLCELVDSLLEPQYKLSRHLKILRQTGLLDTEKDGRWVYHRLVTNPDDLVSLFALIAGLAEADGIYAVDLERFEQRLAHRDGGRCRVGVLTDALKSDAV
jgi:ArsR family transcriptional regulator, arsenate/arsenite/antimonite-responsive transcriptional repressor